MLKIGIIGCGGIGKGVASAIERDLRGKAEIIALCDVDEEKVRGLSLQIGREGLSVSMEELIERSDFVVEAASVNISAEAAEGALSKGKDVLIMSTGGLLKVWERLVDIGKRTGARLYIPSGALCGFDGLKAALSGRVDKVILTTRKPLEGLRGAPFLKERGIDIDSIEGEELLFEGSVEEAIKGFPKNINISASLLHLGVERGIITVKIITSAKYKTNSHELEVEGEFGKFTVKTENRPLVDNPKTSALAVYSAVAVIRDLLGNVKVGT